MRTKELQSALNDLIGRVIGTETRFLTWLLILAIGMAAARYGTPWLLYPQIDDSSWYYGLSMPHTIGAGLFAQHAPKPLFYLLLHILGPHTVSPAFLPDGFALWGLPSTPQLRYVILTLGAVTFWLVPLSGIVARFMTGSRFAGLLVALMMAASPLQNFAATIIDSYVIQIFPLLFVCWRVWVAEPAEHAPDRQTRSGLLTGFACSVAVLVTFHTLFFIVPLCLVIGLRPLLSGVMRAPGAQGLIARPDGFPWRYMFAFAAGILGPWLLVEMVFWLNHLQGGKVLFDELAPAYSFFQGNFRGSSVGDIAGKTRALTFLPPSLYLGLVTDLLGRPGAALLGAALVWCLSKPFLGRHDGIPPSLAIVVILGYAILHSPVTPGLGRLLMPLEFAAFALMAQLVIDGARARPALIKIASLSFAALTAVHMILVSGVLLNDRLGYGRAAAWLDQHAGKVIYAHNTWTSGFKLTPDEVATAPSDRADYVVAAFGVSPEWQAILANHTPMARWRAGAAGWTRFDRLDQRQNAFGGPFNSYIAIYDYKTIWSDLTKGKPR